MLTPKRISKNKLITYLIIIGAMVGGTGVLLAKNYWLAREKAPVIDIPAELGDVAKTAALVSGDQAEQIKASEETAGQEGDSEAIAPASSSQTTAQTSVIDTSLFASEKFQALRDNLTVSAKSKEAIGKRNPFEPYK